ncbi:MAG: aspartate carbamoyltransferase catalytic subunit, partial [Paracoccaceae bacterium]
AARAGGVFWMFGLIHFLVGVGIAVVPPFWTTFRRRRTWYALTDRRAFVATDLPLRGRRLKSYPITSEAVLDFNNEEPATIYFAQQTRRGKNRTYQVNIGFERIADGPEVYQLMRGIQEAAQ